MASYNLASNAVALEPTTAYKNLEEDTKKDLSPEESKPRGSRRIFYLAVVSIILYTILLIVKLGFGISLLTNENTSYSQRQTKYPCKGQLKVLPKSCKDAYDNGQRKSGLVTIRTDSLTTPDEVFCDMESVGGGWTLIASIHEDDIAGQCTAGDMWSTDYDNWLNEKTYGKIEAVTSADYKSRAYYNVNATDMMIWQVPNNVVLSEIDQEAYLKYYTDNGFLSKYGNNLQALYSKHAPFTTVYPKNLLPVLMGCMKSNNWTYPPSYWDKSPHTAPNNSVVNDEIFIEINEEESVEVTNMTSQKIFNGRVDLQMNTTTYPFTALAFIENSDRSIKSFTMKGQPYQHGSGFWSDPWRTYDNILGFAFRSAHICDEVTKGACRIFFALSAYEWNSEDDYNFRVAEARNGANFAVHLNDTFQRVIVGYTVIKRIYEVTQEDQIKHVLVNAVRCFGKLSNKVNFADFPTISTPVKFLRGNISEFNKGVTPGYIQFRQYDHLGFPYPLCPGVRVTNLTSTELYCVGSAKHATLNYQLRHGTSHRCNDFAAWDKLSEHRKHRPASSNYTVVNDISSSLLIFVR